MFIARACLICLLPVVAIATPPDSLWLRTFGGNNGWDWCYALLPATDGGLLLAGQTASSGAGGYDGWLIKTDDHGQMQWSRTQGGADWDFWNAASPTTDGGYVLAGVTESYGNGQPGLLDAWLMKVTSTGDSVWSRSFGGPGAHDGWNSVQQTADGGYICAGWTASHGNGAADVWLLKTDSNGDSLWSRTFGGSGGEFAFAVRQTSDGGYILGGETQYGPYGGEDIWIVKTDSLGLLLWNWYLGTDLKDLCQGLDIAEDGSLFFCGSVHSIDAQIPSDFWVAKFSAFGDSLWTRTIGTEGDYDIARAVKATADGGCFVTGYHNHYLPAPSGPARMWLARFNADGDTLWTRDWGGATDFVSFSLLPVRGDTVLLAGAVYSFENGPDYNWALLQVGPRPSSTNPPPPAAPSSFALSAYPNPFNPRTTIRFSLPAEAHAELALYDETGRAVTTLARGAFTAGEHRIDFDGEALPTGLYFVRLQSGAFSQTQKLLLLK